MTLARLCASSAVALVISAVPAFAQQDDVLKKLGDMKATGAPLEIPLIDQGGAKAERLKEIATKIKVPPGFKVDLFAIVPDARHMAVGNNIGVVFVGTRKAKMYAITDRDGDKIADEVKEFAPSIPKKVPNGVCMSPDGFLYSVEASRILVYPAAEFFYESPDVAVGVVTDELVPATEVSFNHGARVCAVGPDKKLYVSLGQPYNVPPKEKADLYWRQGIGGIIRMDVDGKNREVFARGIRNSVGHAFNPANGQLWFTDNQVDGMGDDIPPGE
jgi:glucose/arabinose dehydrogenase